MSILPGASNQAMKLVLEPALEKGLPVIDIVMIGHMTEVPGRGERENI
jgi:hypothetical protein